MSFTNMSFEFPRDEIVAKVKENRKQHIADFKGAMKGYYIALQEKAEKAEKDLEKFLKRVQKEKDPDFFSISLAATKPRSHEDDYDRAIAMFEMAATETITLDEQSFAQYVLDEWQWKNEFTASSTYYNSKVAAASR